MEKDAYFDRISEWGSAPAGVGFTFLLAGVHLLGWGSDYVNHLPGKNIFEIQPAGRRPPGNRMLKWHTRRKSILQTVLYTKRQFAYCGL
jgi:hypothetical protein